ncbi:MAG: GxxExxY protein [Patescibacteria group bacterium]|nr:GxxExxY protein [Patescibacteria group bacterium]
MNQGGGKLKRKDILYPELSYTINGALFEVFRQMGGGHREKYYQKAVSLALKKRGLEFQEQFYIPVKFDNNVVGKYYLDFLIEDKIVLELKRGNIHVINNIDQVKEYLSALNLKLAIIASFTFDGVKSNRILNEY